MVSCKIVVNVTAGGAGARRWGWRLRPRPDNVGPAPPMEASNLPAHAHGRLEEGRVAARGVGPGAPGGSARGARGGGVRARQPRLRRDWRTWSDADRRIRPRGRVRHAGVRPRRQAARLRVLRRRQAGFLDGALTRARHRARAPRAARPRRAVGPRVGDEHPDRVASVVLINTGALIDYRWHILARIWQTPVLGELFHGHRHPAAVPPAHQPRPEAQAVARVPREHVRRTSTATTRRAVLKHYRAESNPRPGRAPPGRGSAPARHAGARRVGRARPVLGVELAERRQQAFPSARRSWCSPDSGHWPFIDNPEAVDAHVLPFLRELTAAPPRRRDGRRT